MKLSEIIIDSLKYPLDDKKFGRVILFCGIVAFAAIVVSFFGGVDTIFPESYIDIFDTTNIYGLLSIIGAIIAIILYIVFMLIFPGYLLSVMKEGINRSNEVPSFDYGKNILNTLKLWVVSFVYNILPAIITALIFVILIFVLKIDIMNDFVYSSTFYFESAIYQSEAYAAGIAAMFIISIIYIIFYMFAAMGTLRFAKFNKMTQAFNVPEIWADIKQIGILKTVLTFASIAVIGEIIFTTSSMLFGFSPVTDAVFQMLILLPFVSLFGAYALGLLYSEVE